MVVGQDGVIGPPVARPAARAPSPVPVPAPIPFPSMVGWTVVEMITKSGTVLSAIALCTVNGCPSPIGQTAVRVVMRVFGGEQEISSQLNMVVMIAKVTLLRLRFAIHRLVQVRNNYNILKPQTVQESKGIFSILC